MWAAMGCDCGHHLPDRGQAVTPKNRDVGRAVRGIKTSGQRVAEYHGPQHWLVRFAGETMQEDGTWARNTWFCLAWRSS
jgi:hypothetical protein